jgi:hypothetical protein
LSPPAESPLVDVASVPSAAALALLRLTAERSFLAQPLPLKWTVGAAIALRIVPSAPHDGQNAGPDS